MVERTNRTTGLKFLGCSAYPDCAGTRQLASGMESQDNELPSARIGRGDSRRWEKE